jgi:hypothetical protein
VFPQFHKKPSPEHFFSAARGIPYLLVHVTHLAERSNLGTIVERECESSSTEEDYTDEGGEDKPPQSKRKLRYVDLTFYPIGFYGLTPRSVIRGENDTIWLFYLLPGTQGQVLLVWYIFYY